MKNTISNKIRLGIFISVGIAVFIFGIYFIGQKQQLFRSTFRLSGVFKDVAGLQAGNNVRLSGINVGTIDNVAIISDTSVKVEFLIDESTRKFIKKDAVASIGSEGLMGNKVLIINPGTGGKEKIEDNDVIATNKPLDIDDIMLSLKTTIENTSAITGDLASITGKIESGQGTIGRLIMDKSWRENFDSMFVNLKEGSSGFKNFMAMTSDLNEILVSFKSTIDNTSNITSDLGKITDNIQSGKGIMGKLLMDSSSGEEVDSTFVNIKKASEGFNMLMEKAKTSWLLWGF